MNGNGYQREKHAKNGREKWATPGRNLPPSPSGHTHGWTFWGATAMLLTAAVGRLFGVAA